MTTAATTAITPSDQQTQHQQQPIRRVDLVHHATLDSKDKIDPHKYGRGLESRPFRYGFASVDRAIEHQEQRKMKVALASAAAKADEANNEAKSVATAAANSTNNNDVPPEQTVAVVDTAAKEEEEIVTSAEAVSEALGRDSTKIGSTTTIRRVDLVHSVLDAPKDDNSGNIGYVPAIERKLQFDSTNGTGSVNTANTTTAGTKKPRFIDDIKAFLDPTKHPGPADDMYNTRHKHDDIIPCDANGVAPDAAYRF